MVVLRILIHQLQVICPVHTQTYNTSRRPRLYKYFISFHSYQTYLHIYTVHTYLEERVFIPTIQVLLDKILILPSALPNKTFTNRHHNHPVSNAYAVQTPDIQAPFLIHTFKKKFILSISPFPPSACYRYQSLPSGRSTGCTCGISCTQVGPFVSGNDVRHVKQNEF